MWATSDHSLHEPKQASIQQEEPRKAARNAYLFRKRAMSVLSGSAILPTVGGAPSGLDRKALMSTADTSSRGRMIPTFSRCARACMTQTLFSCMAWHGMAWPGYWHTSHVLRQQRSHVLSKRLHIPPPFPGMLGSVSTAQQTQRQISKCVPDMTAMEC